MCVCMCVLVADPGFWKGGFFYRLLKAAAQRCVVLISPREARKNFSPLFFSYQGGLSWHLRALHSKFPDVKGLQDPGPPCASVSCSNFAHAT